MFPKELIPPTITRIIFQMQRGQRFVALGLSAPTGRHAGVPSACPTTSPGPTTSSCEKGTFSRAVWSCSSRSWGLCRGPRRPWWGSRRTESWGWTGSLRANEGKDRKQVQTEGGNVVCIAGYGWGEKELSFWIGIRERKEMGKHGNTNFIPSSCRTLLLFWNGWGCPATS